MGQTRPLRLRYTRPALADLKAILEHIATQSPQGARRVHLRIRSIIELLPRFPHLGRRTGDPAIRRIAAMPYPYLIFYEPTESEVVIHAVRHMARNPSGMPGSSDEGHVSDG